MFVPVEGLGSLQPEELSLDVPQVAVRGKGKAITFYLIKFFQSRRPNQVRPSIFLRSSGCLACGNGVLYRYPSA